MIKKKPIVAGALLALAALVLYAWWGRTHSNTKEERKTAMVVYGDIERLVSATGNVQPQNRLEIKPPIAGRIDQILVVEGQKVAAGQILALLSSTERAALLDAARQQGADAVKEWEDAVKPTALISPIDGEVIVKSVNPGQTVTPSDDVVVLSDRLIVQAQVDETDIGKVKLGQSANISLDAYPDIHVTGKVDHIYYESKIVNNVTIYPVDIVPDQVPEVFRSGMTANVDIVQDRHEHVLLVPREAVKKHQGKDFVLLLEQGQSMPQRQNVEVGISDDNNTEITSGLNEGDRVVIPTTNYKPQTKAPMSSPFMPGGRARGQNR